jgi:hypothetical protein
MMAVSTLHLLRPCGELTSRQECLTPDHADFGVLTAVSLD